jgi:hypothetical protein
MGEGKSVWRGLVGKPEGKRALGRLRLRLEDDPSIDGKIILKWIFKK